MTTDKKEKLTIESSLLLFLLCIYIFIIITITVAVVDSATVVSVCRQFGEGKQALSLYIGSPFCGE